MKSEVNPVVAAVILLIVLAGLGYFMYVQSTGKTFTKAEAQGKGLGGNMDFSKFQLPQNAPGGK